MAPEGLVFLNCVHSVPLLSARDASQLKLFQVPFGTLTDDELYQLGFLLYLAGLDTVANVLTYAFRFLAGRPDLRSLLRDEPDKIPPAVEELLRLFSIASTVRVVTIDTVFAGCPMKAGDRVVLPTASAGRDGGQYHDPDEFRLDRLPNAHLAFGAGPHRCAGAHLARLELRIALEEWHRRIPDYELADDKPVAEYVGAVAGLTALPLRWQTTRKTTRRASGAGRPRRRKPI